MKIQHGSHDGNTKEFLVVPIAPLLPDITSEMGPERYELHERMLRTAVASARQQVGQRLRRHADPSDQNVSPLDIDSADGMMASFTEANREIMAKRARRVSLKDDFPGEGYVDPQELVLFAARAARLRSDALETRDRMRPDGSGWRWPFQKRKIERLERKRKVIEDGLLPLLGRAHLIEVEKPEPPTKPDQQLVGAGSRSN